jgi:hypothetical protein
MSATPLADEARRLAREYLERQQAGEDVESLYFDLLIATDAVMAAWLRGEERCTPEERLLAQRHSWRQEQRAGKVLALIQRLCPAPADVADIEEPGESEGQFPNAQ